MQGHKHFTDKAHPSFRLSERIPTYHLCHRLRELLNWDFLYRETQSLYSLCGRPSLDPVVFFKLLLVGRLENIGSDCRLVRQCVLRLDILYFLGYEVDDELPWHSTISRTRQRYPDTVFEHLFDWVFARCVAQGLVAGERQAVDSAPVKANSSLDSLLEKHPAEEAIPTLMVAESRDSLHLPRLLTGLQRRLQAHGLRLREVLADAAYANGPNYALLEEQGVTAWIPVFGQYKPTIEGFTYDPAADQYICQTGEPLPFQKDDTNQDGGWLKIYWVTYRDCQDCPLKSVCAPKARRKRSCL